MRIERGAVVVLVLSLAVGCASRSGSTSAGGQTGTAQQPAGAPAPAPAPAPAATPGRGGGAAQAAARVTVAQHEAAMKGIAQSNGALQKNLKGNMLPDAAQDAKQLVTLFTEVERFWTQNKKDDAMKLAATARTGAADVVAAATANDQMKAMTAAAGIGGTCKQCHSVYREGDAKTGYTIKAGVVTP